MTLSPQCILTKLIACTMFCGMISTGQESVSGENASLPVSQFESSMHSRGVMRIGAISDDGARSGTGFLVTSGGILVTNYHVVDGCSKIIVCLLSEDGTECSLYPCRLVMSNEEKDLAVIKIEGDLPKDLPSPVTLSNTSPAVLDEVIAVGFPTSLDRDTFNDDTKGNKITNPAVIENFRPNITKGVISKIGTHIIHDSRIGAGNSGGPLISVKTQEVIGVNSAVTKAEGFSLAIPAKDVVDLLKKVYDNKGKLVRLIHYAEHEIPDAMYEYGTRLITGHEGVEIDLKKGEGLLQKAAMKGSKKAAWKLAELYESGSLNHGNPDYEKLIAILSTIDDARSNDWLRSIYADKNTSYFSEEKAFEAASRAVEQGSIANHIFLADFYIHGKGCKQDFEKAIKLLNKVTDAESVPEHIRTAAYQMKVDCALAWCDPAVYIVVSEVVKVGLIGRNVPLRAVDHYILAYAYKLRPYESDEEKNSNIKKAFGHMLEASRMGDGRASMSLGLWTDALLQNEEKAVNFFKKALEQGNPDGHGGLAIIMTKYDLKVAWKIFEKGANLGSRHCATWMGICYNQGIIVEKDLTKAKKYLNLGIKSTNYEAKLMAENELSKIENAAKNNNTQKKKSSSKKARRK